MKSNAAFYMGRGAAHAAQAKFDLAIRYYSKAIELDPKCADAYYNRGHAYANNGQIDLAYDDYNKAMELDPKYSASVSGLTMSHMGSPSSSIPYFEEVNLNKLTKKLFDRFFENRLELQAKLSKTRKH